MATTHNRIDSGSQNPLLTHPSIRRPILRPSPLDAFGEPQLYASPYRTCVSFWDDRAHGQG